MSDWGGLWTDTKLNIVKNYMTAYLSALRNQPFEKIYVDAFAGKGYRNIGNPQSGFFSEFFFGQKVTSRKSGSPRIALEESANAKKPFDRFVFIELNERHARELNILKKEFDQFSNKIDIVVDDANDHLLRFCSKQNWKRTRALLFLDPFGMEVQWETLRAIAETQAIDLWLLFPLGVAVNRLLRKSGLIKQCNRERLNRIFGTDCWYDAFYKTVKAPSLFENCEEVIRKKAGFDEIADFFTNRLHTIFPKNGIPSPRWLYNKKNVPIFLLYFICTNPRGVTLATKIANHILGPK